MQNVLSRLNKCVEIMTDIIESEGPSTPFKDKFICAKKVDSIDIQNCHSMLKKILMEKEVIPKILALKYCCALIGMAAGQIDEDTSELKDLVERYPVQYRDCKAQIAGLLVASEARRLGIDTQSPKLEQIMLQYISNNDTLLSEDGIKTINAYALKGYRLITDYPLFDKPTSREEFLDAFNVAMQFYEKKDS